MKLNIEKKCWFLYVPTYELINVCSLYLFGVRKTQKKVLVFLTISIRNARSLETTLLFLEGFQRSSITVNCDEQNNFFAIVNLYYIAQGKDIISIDYEFANQQSAKELSQTINLLG